MDELTLGAIMDEIPRLNDLPFSGAKNVDSDPSESSRPAICSALRETELLTFGMAPARHHVIFHCAVFLYLLTGIWCNEV